jgi:hypothetical protein
MQALLLLKHTPIMQGQTMGIPDRSPTIGVVMFVGGRPNGGPHHKVAIEIPFVDERAEEILRDEAKQLPNDGIGIVMINSSGGKGRFERWASLLSKRLQPKLHTRVSGVCDFEGSMVPNSSRYDWLVQTELIINSHAKFQLPLWIQDTIEAAGERLSRSHDRCLNE